MEGEVWMLATYHATKSYNGVEADQNWFSGEPALRSGFERNLEPSVARLAALRPHEGPFFSNPHKAIP